MRDIAMNNSIQSFSGQTPHEHHSVSVNFGVKTGFFLFRQRFFRPLSDIVMLALSLKETEVENLKK